MKLFQQKLRQSVAVFPGHSRHGDIIAGGNALQKRAVRLLQNAQDGYFALQR